MPFYDIYGGYKHGSGWIWWHHSQPHCKWSGPLGTLGKWSYFRLGSQKWFSGRWCFRLQPSQQSTSVRGKSGGSYTQQPNLVVLSGPKGKCRWSLSKCYLGSATKVLFKTGWLVIFLLWLKLEGPLMFHSCFLVVATLTLEKTMGQNCVVKTIKKIQQDVW